jgi:hypothetical protein
MKTINSKPTLTKINIIKLNNNQINKSINLKIKLESNIKLILIQKIKTHPYIINPNKTTYPTLKISSMIKMSIGIKNF